jgi:hypothetical protein
MALLYFVEVTEKVGCEVAGCCNVEDLQVWIVLWRSARDVLRFYVDLPYVCRRPVL